MDYMQDPRAVCVLNCRVTPDHTAGYEGRTWPNINPNPKPSTRNPKFAVRGHARPWRAPGSGSSQSRGVLARSLSLSLARSLARSFSLSRALSLSVSVSLFLSLVCPWRAQGSGGVQYRGTSLIRKCLPLGEVRGHSIDVESESQSEEGRRGKGRLIIWILKVAFS